MSYQSSQRVNLSDKEGIFSGGFVDNVQNVDMAPYFSPYLRNCRLDGQSIKIRPGHQIFATLTAGSYPKGIGSYLRTVPANDRLVVRHNQSATQKLVVIDELGAITPVTTAANIASDNRMFFQNIADVVYCMNGSDPFGKLSGTTYTVPSTGVANFSPAFSVVFNGSHWASGRSTNPNKVYKSVGDNYEDFNSTGSDTFTFSETVTGLSASTQALFYFTKNTISVTGPNDLQDTGGTITYTTRTLQTTEGASNNSCIVEVGSNVYYLSSSNALNVIAQGSNIYGYEVKDLSERKYSGISKIMQNLDKDQSSAYGYLLPGEMLIKWFFKSNGAGFNDVCIIYDITKDKFLVDGEKYFFDGVFFKGKNYTVSMIEPKVYQDEYGQTDENSPIQRVYRTKEFYVSDPTLKKIIRETRTLLDINELATVTQNILINGVQQDTKTIGLANYIDAGGGIDGGIGSQSVGEFSIGEESEEDDDLFQEDDDYLETYILRTKGNLNKKGQKFQFEFLCSTLAAKVRLKNLETRFEILDGLATNLTI